MNEERIAGIVGYGRLGHLLAEATEGIEGLSLVWITDPIEGRRLEAQKNHPHAKVTESMRDFPDNLDLVVLATSPGPEGPPIEFFLSRKKNVISAPPLASNSTALARRQQVASQNGVRIVALRQMALHKAWDDFRQKLPEAGELSVIQADLKTFGPFAADMGVHRSHGSWILSELVKLHNGKPKSVSAHGVAVGRVAQGMPEAADLGSLLLEYDAPPAIMLSLSRVASNGELRILALGHRSMIEFIGDLHGKAELRRHARHIRLEGDTVYAAENKEAEIILSDDMDWPKEALKKALSEIQAEEPPDLEADILSAKILDAAWVSLRLKGSPVSLDETDV